MNNIIRKIALTIAVSIILVSFSATNYEEVHADSVTYYSNSIFAQQYYTFTKAYINNLAEGTYLNNKDINFDLLFWGQSDLAEKVNDFFETISLGSKYKGTKYFPLYYFDGRIKNKRFYSSSECFAFASAFASEIFKMDSHGRDGNGDKLLAGENVNSSTISFSSFKTNKIYPGAVIRATNKSNSKGHSMVFLGATQDKIVIADCNFDRTCTVRVAVYSWSNFRNYLSRNGLTKINRIVVRKDYSNFIKAL